MRNVLMALNQLKKDEDGAALIEYTVLQAIVLIAGIATLTLVGTWINGRWTALQAALEGAVDPRQNDMRGHGLVPDVGGAGVGRPAVGFDRRARGDVGGDEAMQRGGGEVLDRGQAKASGRVVFDPGRSASITDCEDSTSRATSTNSCSASTDAEPATPP